jgi:hypothetical protein
VDYRVADHSFALAACRTDVFVVRQPLWFGRSMLTWEA